MSVGQAFETAAVIYPEYYAAGASGTAQLWSRNMTIARLGVGRWRATFTNPHPDGVNYHPTLTVSEPLNRRDARDIQVVDGTKAATGFDYMITTGDNGGAADALQDNPHSVGVTAPVSVQSL